MPGTKSEGESGWEPNAMEWTQWTEKGIHPTSNPSPAQPPAGQLNGSQWAIQCAPDSRQGGEVRRRELAFSSGGPFFWWVSARLPAVVH